MSAMDSLLRFMGSRFGTDDVIGIGMESSGLSRPRRAGCATCQARDTALRPPAVPSAALAILIATARAIFRRVKMPAHGLIHGPNDGVTARSIARSEELDVLDEGVVEQRELDAKLDLLRPLVP